LTSCVKENALKVLITGGAGFIGTHLTKEFLNMKNAEVIAIDDLSTGNEDNIKEFYKNDNYSFYRVDLTKPLLSFDLDTAVKECDLIYHLASVVGVDLVDKEPHKTIKDNLEIALLLFPLAEKYNKKVVFTSTSEVYGDLMAPGGFHENQPLQIKPPTKLRWGYACTKLTQEFMLYSYNFPFVVARLFNVVGPLQSGDFGMVLPRFVKWAKNNEDIKLYGTGKQTRCFCHIKDCVNVLYEMGVWNECDREIINIGTNEEVSMEDLAIRVKSLTKSKSEIVYVPYEKDFSNQHEDIMRRVPNITKLGIKLGYEPSRNLDDIIKDMI